MLTPDKVINIALSQDGYCEKSKTAVSKDKNILYKFTEGAGSDNYTKYGKEMHDIYPTIMDYPAAWCDCFVDWCFYQAYGIANAKSLLGGDFNDYTVASAQLYKKKNAYYSSPKIGDQIFFNRGKVGDICHTGLVYKVDDKYVYTVEGNTSGGNTVVANGGMVCKKKYLLTYSKIDGYGRPKYDGAKEGWTTVGGKKYYYRNDKKLIKEWIKDNGYWYRLGNDGAMLTGFHLVTDDKGKARPCYFDASGRLYHEASDHQGYLEVWLDN